MIKATKSTEEYEDVTDRINEVIADIDALLEQGPPHAHDYGEAGTVNIKAVKAKKGKRKVPAHLEIVLYCKRCGEVKQVPIGEAYDAGPIGG